MMLLISAFLQESDFFMNAMTTALQSQKEQLRKRKKPALKTDADGKPDESPNRKNSDASSSPTAKSDGKETKPTFKVRFLLLYDLARGKVLIEIDK